MHSELKIHTDAETHKHPAVSKSVSQRSGWGGGEAVQGQVLCSGQSDSSQQKPLSLRGRGDAGTREAESGKQ